MKINKLTFNKSIIYLQTILLLILVESFLCFDNFCKGMSHMLSVELMVKNIEKKERIIDNMNFLLKWIT